MMFLTRGLLLGLLSVVTITTGCQSPSMQTPQATAAQTLADGAVMCSKCQVTWVRRPIRKDSGKGSRIVGYRTVKSVVCPECETAAKECLETGKLTPCPDCGDALQKAQVQS